MEGEREGNYINIYTCMHIYIYIHNIHYICAHIHIERS